MTNLLEFDREALAAFCEELGEKRFRATVQDSTNDVFTVLRPLDIVSASLAS